MISRFVQAAAKCDVDLLIGDQVIAGDEVVSRLSPYAIPAVVELDLRVERLMIARRRI